MGVIDGCPSNVGELRRRAKMGRLTVSETQGSGVALAPTRAQMVGGRPSRWWRCCPATVRVLPLCHLHALAVPQLVFVECLLAV